MHHTIARKPGVLGEAPQGRPAGITGLVYKSVRGVTRLVGDYLAASGNPLAIAMGLRSGGTPLTIARDALAAAFPQPGSKLLVLAHGLCMNDLQWNREGHDHGACLARELGFTPVYLHYDTGRHISTNGREFADLMEALVREWPHPIERLAMVCHSMGGLVTRSACHYAKLAAHAWPKRLDRLVFLGTPHLGAPLEHAGAHADLLLEISPYTAPLARLGKIRSAGIKDLSRGSPHEGPLPRGVRCYAIAASKQARPGARGAKIRGDGLVPVNSALGRHSDASLDLGLPEERRWAGYGMGHLELLGRSDVYERIARWLGPTPR